MGRLFAKKMVLVVLLCGFLSPLYGDDALVLPEKAMRFRLKYRYVGIDNRYDNDWNKNSIAELLRQGVVNEGVALKKDGEYELKINGYGRFHVGELQFEYGITDSISAGFLLGYFFEQNQVAESALIRGENFADTSDSLKAAFANQYINEQSRSSFGVADFLLGFKHQVYGTNTSMLRFAYLPGIRVPIGQANIYDSTTLPAGDGQWDAGIWLYFDVQPIEYLILNLHSRLEYQFAGKKTVLNPTDSEHIVAMEFQPGIYTYLEFDPKVQFHIDKALVHLRTPFIFEKRFNNKAQEFDEVEQIYRGDLKTINGSAWTFFKTTPEIGVLLLKYNIPLGINVQYQFPIIGNNLYDWWHIQIGIDIFATL